MPRPRRTRKVAKWTGTVAVVVLASAWGLSLFGRLAWTRDDPVWTAIILDGGAAVIVRWDVVDRRYPNVTRPAASRTQPKQWTWDPRWRGQQVWFPSILFFDTTSGMGFGTVPIWLPLVLFALPTAYLWWADWARARPGLCPKCRYDRAGLAEAAPCPECGAKAVAS